jgi:dipeptidyl-peptidase 4
LFLSKCAPAMLCLLAAAATPALSASDVPQAPSRHLSAELNAIFNKYEIARPLPQLAWQNGGDSYTVIEPAAGGKGVEMAAYDSATGRRTVLVSPPQLTPTGATQPLAIESYDWSADRKKLLIFTNSKRVWRENTRGDYWVLDLGASTPETRLIKLGGDAPVSSLMFATFSPDSTRVHRVPTGQASRIGHHHPENVKDQPVPPAPPVPQFV